MSFYRNRGTKIILVKKQAASCKIWLAACFLYYNYIFFLSNSKKIYLDSRSILWYINNNEGFAKAIKIKTSLYLNKKFRGAKQPQLFIIHYSLFTRKRWLSTTVQILTI
jgi:hypothetical protein